MKTGLLILFISIFFAECKKRNKIPNHILSQSKMQAVMWDMIRADKFLTDFVLIKDTTLNKNRESIKLYQQVLGIHHISKEEFQQSFAFYRAHPNLLKEVLDSLNARPDIAPTELYKPRPLRDTLHPMKKIIPLPHKHNDKKL
jgi:hypothetical protein